MQVKSNKTNMLAEVSFRLLTSFVIPFATGLLFFTHDVGPGAEDPPDPSPPQDLPSGDDCEVVEALSGSGGAAILCPAENVPEAGVVFVCGDSGLMAGVIDQAPPSTDSVGYRDVTWSTLLNGLPIGETRFFIGRPAHPVASSRETTWLRTDERGNASAQLAADLTRGDVHMRVSRWSHWGTSSSARHYVFRGTPERAKYLSYRLPQLLCTAGASR